MRTRTFIGLSILVLLLMIASTPALLIPASVGVQRAAVAAGVPGIDAPTSADATTGTKQAKSQVAALLAVRGRVVQKDGSLRDQYNDRSRLNSRTIRLDDGASRTTLPGQTLRGVDAPPNPLKDGISMDLDGCPVFSPNQDVAAIWKDPKLKARYASRIAGADDPKACTALVQKRRDEATGASSTLSMPVDDRRKARALLRGGTSDVGFLFAYDAMLASILPDAEAQTTSTEQALADLRASE